MVASLLLCVLAAPPEPGVLCPPIGHEDRPRTNFLPNEYTPQPELIVLGTTRRVGDVWEMEVEKVLLGHYPGKTLRHHRDILGNSDRAGRRIVALTPDLAEPNQPFHVHSATTADEVAAVQALIALRLEFNALAADAILVGQEVAAPAGNRRTVAVVRALAGTAPPKGQRVTVELAGVSEKADKPVLRQEPGIYFLRDTPAGLRCVWRVPIAHEAAVLDARRRVADHPVRELEGDDGKKVRLREVIFRGSLDQALVLLGSTLPAAVQMGEARLLAAGKAALPVLRPLAAELLGCYQDAKPGHARRLKHVLDILGRLEGRHVLRALLDQHLDDILAGLEPPAIPKRDRGAFLYVPEEDRDDAHHGATWLARALGSEVVYREYAQRLLRMRDRAAGLWRDELQLALDVCGIEDRVELEAALARSRDVKPPRSSGQPVWHRGLAQVAFSPDGQHLASATSEEVRVWETRSWSLVSRFRVAAGQSLGFAPDGKRLYLSGGWNPATRGRYDWRTGKLDRAYLADGDVPEPVALTADGRRLVGVDAGNKALRVWDTTTGQVLRSVPIVKDRAPLILSPDGAFALRAEEWRRLGEGFPPHSRPVWTVVPLDGRAPPALPGLADRDAWLFAPSGKHLISAEVAVGQALGKPFKPGVTLRVHDPGRGYAVVASRWLGDFGSQLAVSGDGTRLAVTNRDDSDGPNPFRVSILTLPGLEPVSVCVVAPGVSFDGRSVALSPDGATLALSSLANAGPYLFDATTGKRILPTPGHVGPITRVHFSADGKTLRTYGRDGFVCHWDAATLQVRARVALPPMREVVAVREPEGRHAACAEDGSLVIVDTDTGRTVATLKSTALSPRWLPSVRWLDDREAVLVTGTEVIRFDWRTGALLDTVKRTPATFYGLRKPEWHPETKSLVWAESNGRSCRLELRALNIETGATSDLGERAIEEYSTGNSCGLIPGGKYIYIGSPGLHILDRRTLNPVMTRFARVEAYGYPTFSPDGERFAVVTGERTAPVVRVHATATGTTLAALRMAEGVSHLCFSPDGQRLAVVHDDGSLAVWSLRELLPR